MFQTFTTLCDKIFSIFIWSFTNSCEFLFGHPNNSDLAVCSAQLFLIVFILKIIAVVGSDEVFCNQAFFFSFLAHAVDDIYCTFVSVPVMF